MEKNFEDDVDLELDEELDEEEEAHAQGGGEQGAALRPPRCRARAAGGYVSRGTA